MNYYNEFDPFAAAWLEELIKAGLIPDGYVDKRSITEVKPEELAGYDQHHWFAGIAGWSRALQLAGWDAAWPVWSGSCPCQPFSAAGKRKGRADDRNLWHIWFELIRVCRPEFIVGEQVESAIGMGWLDRVLDDLEAEGYQTWACVLPACSVGAPHIRSRLWWCARLAHSEVAGVRGEERNLREAECGSGNALLQRIGGGGASNRLVQSMRSGAGDNAGASCGQGRESVDSGAEGIRQGNGQIGASGAESGGSSGGLDYSASPRCDSERAGTKAEAWDEARMRRPECGCSDSGMVHAQGNGRQQGRTESERRESAERCQHGGMGDSEGRRQEGNLSGKVRRERDRGEPLTYASGSNATSKWLGDAGGERLKRIRPEGEEEYPTESRKLSADGFWRDSRYIYCRDGKWRRVPLEPALFPLAPRLPGRVGLLRGAGNSICSQVAAEFIKAVMNTF